MKRSVLLLLLLLLLSLAGNALAHEVPDDVRIHVLIKPAGNKLQLIARVPANAFIDNWFPTIPGTNYLDLAQTNPLLAAAAYTWVSDLITVYEGDTRLPKPAILATILSRQSDPSYNSYAEALAHVTGPALPMDARVILDRAAVDVLLEVPIRSDRSDFTLVPRFGRLGVMVTTTIGFLPPGGGIRNYEYEGDPDPFKLNPSWDQSAAHFIQAGFLNIFDETDHLILLFCVVLLFRRYRALMPFAVAFTVAHSLALILSAFGSTYNFGSPGPWMPPLAGTLMALSVVYLALECIVNPNPRKNREIFATASGIFYGFGFWFSLRPVLQFGGNHPIVSILSFNLGIEICQLLALTLLCVFFYFVSTTRIVDMILAGLVAHMDWHRMTERAYALNRFETQLQWPVFGASWMFAALILAALIWLALNRKTLLNRKTIWTNNPL
jgi:hypothetical protein